MKNKIFYIALTGCFALMFFYSCDSSNSRIKNHELESEVIEENENSYNPALNEEWIKDNTPNKNENLINFEYKLGSQNDYEKFGDILLRPYEKNETKIKHSEIEITEHKDSMVLSFWQNRILEGCVINGNLEIYNDTLKLIFEKICSPFEEFTDGEIVTLYHKYTIKPVALRKNIIIEKRVVE